MAKKSNNAMLAELDRIKTAKKSMMRRSYQDALSSATIERDKAVEKLMKDMKPLLKKHGFEFGPDRTVRQLMCDYSSCIRFVEKEKVADAYSKAEQRLNVAFDKAREAVLMDKDGSGEIAINKFRDWK